MVSIRTSLLKNGTPPRRSRLREEAELLPPGPVRDAALRKARQAETESHMQDWLSSPGLRKPE